MSIYIRFDPYLTFWDFFNWVLNVYRVKRFVDSREKYRSFLIGFNT
jgi:hypothetical protein